MPCPVIELRGVCKAFGAHRVIDGLDLPVPARSIFAFLGNNGEGKSTTIRLITGQRQRSGDAVAGADAGGGSGGGAVCGYTTGPRRPRERNLTLST